MKTLVILILVAAAVLVVILVMARPQPRRKRISQAEKEEALRDVAALTAHLRKDTLLMRSSTTQRGSYLGGAPPASAQLRWPAAQDGRPLSFLACIDCAELPASSQLDWLPRAGRLLFFYDLKTHPWGFDPKDRGGFATVHLPASAVAEATQFATPPKPLPKKAVLPRKDVTFQLVRMPPPPDAPELADTALGDEESDALDDRRSELRGDGPQHQMGGYPDNIQSAEMAWECELVSHGIYCGNSAGFEGARAAALRESAADWSLLLQIDTDDGLDLMWGDGGMLYFWVRREEARRLDFANVWVILQCC